MADGKYPRTVFVLGTDRNIGKTVTCIGIIAKLLSPSCGYAVEEIGYIKPVGQETLTVLSGAGVPIQADKDAVLITSLMGIQSHGYEKASPVVWRGGVTASYIDESLDTDPLDGRQAFLERICESFEHVAMGKRIVIVEGTGQPGVGSVAGISNADVINTLRGMGVPVFVVMVTQGGIGSTIDQVFPYLLALDHMGTRLDGLIINDVIPGKLSKIEHYLGSYYTKVFQGLYGDRLTSQSVPPIMGFVPSVEELRLPTMRLIAEKLAGRSDSGLEVVAPDDFDEGGCRLVRRLRVISLEFGYEAFVKPGDAVIVGINANDVILSILLLHERLQRQQGEGLSGLLLSCKGVGGLSPEIAQLLQQTNLPTITLNYDSADTLEHIKGMTVKIQPYDLHKRALISQTYDRHLSLFPELELCSS
jgi:dethiobiotin synthetase